LTLFPVFSSLFQHSHLLPRLVNASLASELPRGRLQGRRLLFYLPWRSCCLVRIPLNIGNFSGSEDGSSDAKRSFIIACSELYLSLSLSSPPLLLPHKVKTDFFPLDPALQIHFLPPRISWQTQEGYHLSIPSLSPFFIFRAILLFTVRPFFSRTPFVESLPP